MLLREEEPVTDPPPVKTLLLAFLIMFQGPHFPRSMLEADGPIGIMENEMETTIVYWGYYIPIMENQMEKNMENEMETPGPFQGVYRDIALNNGEVTSELEHRTLLVLCILGLSFFPASWEFSETDGLPFASICCVHPALVCSPE